MINKKLNRDQWFQLDDQMRRTPTEPDVEDELGQHFILMALLSKFGYSPNSKWEAMKLADNLLNAGWEELEI